MIRENGLRPVESRAVNFQDLKRVLEEGGPACVSVTTWPFKIIQGQN